MELTKKQQNTLLKLANVVDNGELAIIDELNTLDEKIDSISENTSVQIENGFINLSEKLGPKENQDVTITNRVDTHVTNFPDSVSIREPSWFSWEGIKEHLSELVLDIKGAVFNVSIVNPQKEVMIVDEDGKPIDFKHLGKDSSSTKYVGGGGSLGLTLEPLVTKLVGEYAILIDDVTTTGMTYVGKAAIGSATSTASWQIKRLDESGTPTTLVIKWCDGDANFNNIWDNRASLTYN